MGLAFPAKQTCGLDLVALMTPAAFALNLGNVRIAIGIVMPFSKSTLV